MADRERQAKQTKHDICISRMLRLFEKKAKYAGNELKKTLGVIIDCCNSLLHQSFIQSNENVMAALKQVDFEKDVRCVHQAGDAS